MITKENLLVAKIVSKSPIKEELKCIAFYGDRTVATDSFRLMEVPVSAGEKLAEPILMLADTVKIPKGFVGIEEPNGFKIDKTYPDIDVIMNNDTDIEYVELSINGAIFGELLTQMGKLNKFKEVKVRVPLTKYKAIRLEAKCDHLPKNDERKARGLIMPMNK
jgi:hypothetical protein